MARSVISLLISWSLLWTAALSSGATASGGDTSFIENSLALLFAPRDDRRSLTVEEATRYRATGVIQVHTSETRGYVGAGTVISPLLNELHERDFDLILTAYHNFVDKDCNLLSDEIRFYPANNRSYYVPIRPENIIPERRCQDKFNNQFDRALVVVPRIKLKHGKMRPLALWSIDAQRAEELMKSQGATFNLVSYNTTSKQVAITDDCRLSRLNSAAIEYYGVDAVQTDCDYISGASGGALMVSRAGRDYLVGIIKGNRQTVRELKKENYKTYLFPYDPHRTFNVISLLRPSFVSLIEEVSEAAQQGQYEW